MIDVKLITSFSDFLQRITLHRQTRPSGLHLPVPKTRRILVPDRLSRLLCQYALVNERFVGGLVLGQCRPKPWIPSDRPRSVERGGNVLLRQSQSLFRHPRGRSYLSGIAQNAPGVSHLSCSKSQRMSRQRSERTLSHRGRWGLLWTGQWSNGCRTRRPGCWSMRWTKMLLGTPSVLPLARSLNGMIRTVLCRSS